MAAVAGQIDDVRTFNRFYTQIIGVLDEGLLETPYSLTEARVIFELAQQSDTDVTSLRRLLGLDAGYLSRILTRFENDGLVTRQRAAADGRRQVVRLTGAGQAAYEMLNSRSATEISTLLDPLTEDSQRRVLAAMAAIRDVLGDVPRRPGFVLRPLQPGDLGWVVHRHGVLYADDYAWDETFEALVARIVADYVDHRDVARESAWIAESAGEPVGCVFCVGKDDETAQLRLLLVESTARGMGVGTALVDECLRFAQKAGYRRIVLWTNSVLDAARRIYERTGFQLENEEPHRSFGHDLVGQYWSRDL